MLHQAGAQNARRHLVGKRRAAVEHQLQVVADGRLMVG